MDFQNGDQLGPLERPIRIRNYELRELIGRGAFAFVYRAINSNCSGLEVAVKRLRREHVDDDGVRRRMRSEAEIVSRLSRHDNIVKLHDLIDQPPELCLVMELVPGGRTLADRILGGPLPLPELARVGRQACSALAHAHARGIIHRDLKPQNLLLDADHDDRVMVTDFGLARHLQPQPPAEGSPPADRQVYGTLAYMAPEQAGGEADERSDIFSLSVTLFEAATGWRPFPSGGNPLATLKNILESPPDWRNVELDQGLRLTLAKGLQKDPRERYPSAELLGRHFELLASGPPDLRDAPRGPTIIGRTQEMDRLLGTLNAVSGIHGRGRSVLVSGEAGIGKTELVEALGRVLGQRPRVPFGRARFTISDADYGPLSKALRAVAARVGGASDDDLRLFPSKLPELIETAARGRPYVVVLEDLQLAHPDGLRAVRIAMQAMPGTPGLLVATFRPGDPRLADLVNWAIGEDLADEMRLGPLDVEATRDLIGLKLDLTTPPDPATCERLHRHSGGNPLFLCQTIKQLRGAGLIGAAGSLEVGDEPLPIPVLVESLLRERLAVGPDLAPMLEAGTVAAEPFDIEVLAELCALDPKDAEQRLAALVELELLREATDGYRFVHGLMSEIVAKTTRPGRARKLHARLASRLLRQTPPDAAGIGRHLVAAGRRAEAVDWLYAAARAARTTSANDEAIRLYREAEAGLAESGAHAEVRRTDVLIELGDRLLLTGKRDEARAAFQAVAQQAYGDIEVEALSDYHLGRVYWVEARAEDALRYWRSSLKGFRRNSDRHWSAASSDAIGNALRDLGRLDEALRATEEGLRLRAEIDFKPGIADSQLNLGNIYYLQGDARKALHHYALTTRYHRDNQANDLHGGLGRARTMEGLALAKLAQFDHAIRAHRESIGLFERSRNRQATAHVRVNLAQGYAQAGQLALARREAEDAEAAARAIGTGLEVSLARCTLGKVLLDDGAEERALQLIEEARRLASDAGFKEGLLLAERCLALAFLRSGDHDGAAAPIARARTLVMAAPTYEASLAYLEARRHQQAGNRAASERAYREALELISQRSEPDLEWRVLNDLGRLLDDDDATRPAAAELRGRAIAVLHAIEQDIVDPDHLRSWRNVPERAAVLGGSASDRPSRLDI